MNDLTRWSLKVSKEADIGLRTLLATRGARKGDLSKFVEDAVNRAVLRETVRDIHARNGDLAADDVDRLIDEELGAVRASLWADRR